MEHGRHLWNANHWPKGSDRRRGGRAGGPVGGRGGRAPKSLVHLLLLLLRHGRRGRDRRAPSSARRRRRVDLGRICAHSMDKTVGFSVSLEHNRKLGKTR